MFDCSLFDLDFCTKLIVGGGEMEVPTAQVDICMLIVGFMKCKQWLESCLVDG